MHRGTEPHRDIRLFEIWINWIQYNCKLIKDKQTDSVACDKVTEIMTSQSTEHLQT